MNSTVKSNFKVIFAEKSTCTFHEQCTGSTKKTHPLGNAQNALPKLTHSWGIQKDQLENSTLNHTF